MIPATFYSTFVLFSPPSQVLQVLAANAAFFIPESHGLSPVREDTSQHPAISSECLYLSRLNPRRAFCFAKWSHLCNVPFLPSFSPLFSVQYFFPLIYIFPIEMLFLEAFLSFFASIKIRFLVHFFQVSSSQNIRLSSPPHT